MLFLKLQLLITRYIYIYIFPSYKHWDALINWTFVKCMKYFLKLATTLINYVYFLLFLAGGNSGYSSSVNIIIKGKHTPRISRLYSCQINIFLFETFRKVNQVIACTFSQKHLET